MFRHVVMFRWNDEVTDEQLVATSAALDALPAAIEQIVEYRHGPDQQLADGNFDYVVVADFASVDDYLVYRDHPEHRRLIAEHITERVAQRAAAQYELDG